MTKGRGCFSQIPVVDVAPLFQGDLGLIPVAQAIGEAYRNVGFAYIVNHGIPESLVHRLFNASAGFHALPRAEKMKIEINPFHRGFVPINTSTARTSSVARVTRPNQSESFMMMHELPPNDPEVLAGADLAGPNQWPDGLPGFRDVVQRYNAELTALARLLVRAMAVALGQSADVFEIYFRRPTTFLRLLYYPPQEAGAPDDLYGSAPHTDYGFLTILAQDEVGGLQVRNVNGNWIDAPHQPGSFVMNVGDTLHRWSNGQFISTPHRVINRAGRARYSCPFFFDPDMRAEIRPFDSCVEEEQSVKYEPLVYGDYLMARLRANHDQHAGLCQSEKQPPIGGPVPDFNPDGN